MGKGEIARYEHFLFFSQCFQKACFPEASKGVIVWEWVKQMQTYNCTKVSTKTRKTKAVTEVINTPTRVPLLRSCSLLQSINLELAVLA